MPLEALVLPVIVAYTKHANPANRTINVDGYTYDGVDEEIIQVDGGEEPVEAPGGGEEEI